VTRRPASPAPRCARRARRVVPRDPARARRADGAFVVLDGESTTGSRATTGCAVLMSLASDTDLWMFVTSGAADGGRVDATAPSSPTRTSTGCTTATTTPGRSRSCACAGGRARGAGQPFARPRRTIRGSSATSTRTSSATASSFEEVRHDLGLEFATAGRAANEFGWVRTARAGHRGAAPARSRCSTACATCLPWGARSGLTSSRARWWTPTSDRLRPETRLGIFSLTSRIIDRPEASEALRANRRLVPRAASSTSACRSAVAAFPPRRGAGGEATLTGRRGNYLVVSSLELAPRRRRRVHLAADAGLGHVQLAAGAPACWPAGRSAPRSRRRWAGRGAA